MTWAGGAPPEARFGVDRLRGGSTPMATLRATVRRAGDTAFSVLVEGESGTGKELVARALHEESARRIGPFGAVNCAAVSDELFEAELFGHARGAFTGAVGARPGLFEATAGGTIFLDEVGELSPRAQAKLLRVLQDGEIRRLGENHARRLDVRVVAATNRSLTAETSAGRFRADLRYRLDVVHVDVPPLRDRPADVGELVDHFWPRLAAHAGTRARLAPATLRALRAYAWPGNVRQLQNVLTRLAVAAPRHGLVGPDALPGPLQPEHPAPRVTLAEARVAFDRDWVWRVLERTGGHRGAAARELGISRQGLAKLMTRLSVSWAPPGGSRPAGAPLRTAEPVAAPEAIAAGRRRWPSDPRCGQRK